MTTAVENIQAGMAAHLCYAPAASSCGMSCASKVPSSPIGSTRAASRTQVNRMLRSTELPLKARRPI